ncbi:PREDICTED: uncharacterized protein LOC108559521 [Nicrophorus vespilloides]|uniref:Uncharacterized protein LOC108559521 n=1 Tax=Nicrophorus vespilloides TaxID=110193 RepID=A0ABM1MCL3_NICVS|nr:PREDICTED: uncharacterized protein LOC108559521 [Nicrophorus vespilloides]
MAINRILIVIGTAGTRHRSFLLFSLLRSFILCTYSPSGRRASQLIFLERKMQAVQVKYGGGFLNDELVLWKKQKEYARYKKCQEQKQVRDMMENYWPWEDNAQVKPRGLKNLRLDGLFPQRDFENAKRFSGILDLGRPGGGAPNVNRDTGRKLLKTREDPLLRFQWGKDLRNTVDNKLRYHTDKNQQEKYRKELGNRAEMI